MNLRNYIVIFALALIPNLCGMGIDKKIDFKNINYAIDTGLFERSGKINIFISDGPNVIGQVLIIVRKNKTMAEFVGLEIYPQHLYSKGLGSHLFKTAMNLLCFMEIERVGFEVMSLQHYSLSEKELEVTNKRLEKFYSLLGCRVVFQDAYLNSGYAEIDPYVYADYKTVFALSPKKVKRTRPRSRKNLYPKEVAV